MMSDGDVSPNSIRFGSLSPSESRNNDPPEPWLTGREGVANPISGWATASEEHTRGKRLLLGFW